MQLIPIPSPTKTELCEKVYYVKTDHGVIRKVCQRTSFHPGSCGPSRQTTPPANHHFAA